MYLFAEVVFYSGMRQHLPADGYRPDALFEGESGYWGITFIQLPVAGAFDLPAPAAVRFSFDERHYDEVAPGQRFSVMEGARKVGEGRIISIEYGEP